jgi:hypothetical protein
LPFQLSGNKYFVFDIFCIFLKKKLKMKKIILVLTIGLLLISCSSSDGNSSNSSGNFMWRCKINGVLYEWSGNEEENFSQGASIDFTNSLILKNNDLMISPTNFLQNNSPGNYTFSQSSGKYCVATFFGESYSSYGGSMNFIITSVTPYTSQTYDVISRKLTGTFSGTLKNVDPITGGTLLITEGSFVAFNID